jgi:DHA1 family bicyclomycin/chloramphenicol resistance-like MFS transporter
VSFALASGGYLAGTTCAARFVARWGSGRLMGVGCAAMASSGVMLVLLLALGPYRAEGVVAAICVYLFGMGMSLPQSQAGALLPFPDRAGAASSLLGFITLTSSALVGVVIGRALGASAWPLAIAVLIAGGLSFVLWWFSRSVRARGMPAH